MVNYQRMSLVWHSAAKLVGLFQNNPSTSWTPEFEQTVNSLVKSMSNE